MILLLSPHSPLPLYLQIVRQIQTLVLTVALTPGEALPSLRQLAVDTGVSLITTKRAYEELEVGGWIVTQVGRGTRVADLAPGFLAEQRRKLVTEPLAEARTLALRLGVSREEADRIWKSLWEMP